MIELAGRVRKLVCVVGVEVPRFYEAVLQASLLSGQEGVLPHAKQAAVGALGHGGDSDLHFAIFSELLCEHAAVKHFLVRHYW